MAKCCEDVQYCEDVQCIKVSKPSLAPNIWRCNMYANIHPRHLPKKLVQCQPTHPSVTNDQAPLHSISRGPSASSHFVLSMQAASNRMMSSAAHHTASLVGPAAGRLPVQLGCIAAGLPASLSAALALAQ